MNFVANELTVDNASIVGFGYHLMKRTAVMNIAQLYQTGVVYLIVIIILNQMQH
jgi:putative endopeptidase